jgi:hypothetical protein
MKQCVARGERIALNGLIISWLEIACHAAISPESPNLLTDRHWDLNGVFEIFHIFYPFIFFDYISAFS